MTYFCKAIIFLFFAITIHITNVKAEYINSNACLYSKQRYVPGIALKKYSDARKLLIKNGWQPIASRWQDAQDMDAYAKKLFYRGFTEVTSCTVDTTSCQFYFKDNYNNILKVEAGGEEYPDPPSGVSNQIVEGFNFVCQVR